MAIDDLKDVQIYNLQYPDQDGLTFTGKWEGWRDHWYQDVAGVWTWGYGHAKDAGDIVDPNARFTEADGYFQLLADMARCVRPLIALAQKYPGLRRQNRINALADWLFNCGPGAIGTEANPSHVLEGIMRDDVRGIREGLALWCKVVIDGVKVTNVGLHNRRISEGILWTMAKSPVMDLAYGAPTDRGLTIAVPDEEIERRGEVILWDTVGAAEDDDRAADLERRNKEAGFS